MTSYLSKFIGADHLPRRLSEFEVQQFFRLLPEDVLAIKERFRADRRVGPAIQLVFLRSTGCQLDRFTIVPPILLKSLGEELGVRLPTIASLKAIYKRRETLSDHQIWARQHLGLVVADKDRLTELSDYLELSAAQATSVDELVSLAKHRLFELKILIPADRTLRDLARAAFSQIEQSAVAAITSAIPEQEIQSCRNVTFSRREASGSTTVLEWLKTPPKRHSPTALSETLEKIRFLRDLGVHKWAIDSVSLERQRAYSQALANRPPSETKKRIDATQILEIVFFLRVTLLELTDTVIYQAGRRVSDLVRQAYDKTQVKQARSSVEYRDRLVGIKTLVADTSRPAEERLAAIGVLVADIGETPSTSHAASVRQTLAAEPSRVRALLSSLQDLDFQGRANDNSLKLLNSLREIYAGKLNELPGDQSFPVDKPWQELVNDPDRGRALKALEACAMVGLRKSLRRGSVWIDHSFSYRSRDQLLISPSDWEDQRGRHLSILGLPLDAQTFIEPLLKHIQAGLAAVAEAKQAGNLTIDAQGMLHLPKLEALLEEMEPRRTRDLMFKQIGGVQFPDLLLEMDAQTNFSEILLARRARDEKELVALYAALIAHGTEIDAKSVTAMTPQLSTDQISVAMRALEAPGRLRRANERVVEFQGKHAIADLWGSGKTASSDMMSLDTSKHLWNARVDPRRRTHAAGIYTMCWTSTASFTISRSS